MVSMASSLIFVLALAYVYAAVGTMYRAHIGMRWFIGNQMKDHFVPAAKDDGVETQEEPDVSFGATPLVIGL